MRTWQLQEARGRFKDLFDQALRRPQRVTRHGKSSVVVIAEEEWKRVTENVPSFGKLLAQCPLVADELPPRRTARAIRRGTFG